MPYRYFIFHEYIYIVGFRTLAEVEPNEKYANEIVVQCLRGAHIFYVVISFSCG